MATSPTTRVPLNKESYSVALRIAQTNASAHTRIYGLEAEISPQGESHLAA
jgi:hypothetical protein